MDTTVILGAKGMVGGQLRKLLPDAVALDRDSLDVTDFGALRTKLLELRPDIIINCVAYNDVDGAESNRDTAFLLNAQLVEQLAKIASEIDAILVQFSTGYVFDDSRDSHNEDDEPHPLSVYAESKLASETATRKYAKKYYIIRTNGVFGPQGESANSKKSFVQIMLSLAQSHATVKAVADETNSITYATDLAKTVVSIIEDRLPYSIYHVINEGSASWHDFAREIFTLKKLDIDLVPVPGSQFPRAAKRPHRNVINNTKLPKLRSWQSALADYLNHSYTN